jgi:dienelactone hydrolase
MLVEKKVPYSYEGKPYEGMLVYDDAVKGKRPAVFMQPDWKGVCLDTVGQAKEVAGKDYVVMMADMFGVGYGAKQKSYDDLMAASSAVHKDLKYTLGCGGAALKALTDEANGLGLIDTAKSAAIGYCFGAGLALEQARAGTDFKAIVAFHVTYPNKVDPSAPTNIKGRVLALHGSADPVTPKAAMDQFEEDLSAAKVDWQVMMFGGAVHSFCDPTANAGPTRYDAKLCRKSYAMMRDFFAETL